MFSQQWGITHQAESQDSGGGRGRDDEEVVSTINILTGSEIIVKGACPEEDSTGQTEGGVRDRQGDCRD